MKNEIFYIQPTKQSVYSGKEFKKGMLKPHNSIFSLDFLIVPDTFKLLLEIPFIKNSKKQFEFQRLRKFLGCNVNWEMVIIIPDVTITFRHICLTGWHGKGGLNPKNNIIELTMTGNEINIKEILHIIATEIPKHWDIQRKKLFEKRFKITVSEVENIWKKYID